MLNLRFEEQNNADREKVQRIGEVFTMFLHEGRGPLSSLESSGFGNTEADRLHLEKTKA
jgi:hypothetical protein